MFAVMLKSSKHLVELLKFWEILKYNLFMHGVKFNISNYYNIHAINVVYIILAVYTLHTQYITYCLL